MTLKGLSAALFSCVIVLFRMPYVMAGDGKIACDAERKEIASLVQKLDIEGLEHLATNIESDFARSQDTIYFTRMNALCQELTNAARENRALMPLLMRLTDYLLLKDIIPEQTAVPLYLNQADAIQRLLFVVAPPAGATNEDWTVTRAHICRLTMMFTKRVKQYWIPDYVPEKAYVNVRLPPNIKPSSVPPGFAAGGDPAEIADPEARAEYMAAIKLNGEKLRKNAEQRELAEIIRGVFPELERGVIRLYSAEPTSYEEIAEYCDLGGFDVNDRSRIISSIARQTGKQPVAWLMNQVIDSSKSKTQGFRPKD